MANHPKYRSTFGFLDILFNLSLVMAVLFVLSFLLINPITKSGTIDPRTHFIIKVSWPDGNPNDIDVWVKSSQRHIIGFRSKDSEIMHLDRDDVGRVNDYIIINGSLEQNSINQEIVSIRQQVDMKYTVNIHYFSWREDDGAELKTPVKIELIRIQPFEVIKTTEVIMTSEGQEKTALVFETFGGVDFVQLLPPTYDPIVNTSSNPHFSTPSSPQNVPTP
tara:strand:+ start:925 stop:1584 length:660 start_codon:yes stop_codon:yes gene_type:complete